jgi:capsular exopolysaccharide synthesis family protein
MTYRSAPNNFPPVDPRGAEEETLDIKALVFSVLRKWYWIALCAVVALVLGRVYLRYAEPIFQSKITVLIKDEDSSAGALSEDIVLQELGIARPKSNISNEIQFLKSRALMSKAMENLGLGVRYFGLGQVRNKELYNESPVLVDSIRWAQEYSKATLLVEVIDTRRFRYFVEEDGEEVARDHRFGKPLVLEQDTFWLRYNPNNHREDIRTMIKAGVKPGNYLEQLSIRNIDDFSSVLTLEIEDPVARKAADLLNMLIRVYNESAIDNKSQVASQTLDFIDERLRLLTDELSSVEGGLESYKQRNQIPAETAGTIDIILNEISSYDNAMTQQQIKLELLGAIEEMLERDVEEFELIPANLILEDASGLNQQIAQYNELLSNRERLKRSAAVNNPQLIETNQQLAKMRGNIVQSIDLYKRSVRLTTNETQQKISELQRRISQVPRQERELLEIKRQQNIKEALYLYLLQKKEEMALSAAIVLPNAQVIDAAVPNLEPIAPVPNRVYAVCFLLGLALPIGVIFLREMLDTNIYEESDIERLSDIPILGVLPEAGTKEKVVVTKESRSAIAERFRLLRTNLNYVSRRKDHQTILLTSGEGGDGKTFLTINLAISLALNGHKTVVIGMDLRKPKLSEYLVSRPDHNEKGVSNFLIGDMGPEQIVSRSEINKNLYYIPSGPLPPNPAELLSNKPLVDKLFEYVQAEFDYILIDTSPVGLVTDALLLQAYADVSLFVVRSGKTPKEVLRRVDAMSRDGKLTNPAIILNGVTAGKGYGYYGKSNGYYYENTKKSWLSKLKSKV